MRTAFRSLRGRSGALRAATLETLRATRGVFAIYDFGDKAAMFTANNTTTPVASNDDSVGNVINQTGNGYAAQQGTADNKPTYKVAGLASGPGVDFDGTDDYLLGASLPGYSGAFSFALSGAFAGGEQVLFDISDGTTSHRILAYSTSASSYRFLISGTGGLRETNDTTTDRSAAHVYSGTVTDGDLLTYLNGTQDGSASGANITPVGTDELGIGWDPAETAGFLLDGTMGMLVFADVVWTAAERNRVEWALARRIGVTIA